MPDVNNSLAAQIQVPQIDIGGTLEKAARIQNLGTENELKQQELKHRQFLYDQGGGFEDVELNGVFGPLYFARWQLVAEQMVCSLRDKLPEHLQKEFCDRAIKAISPPRTYH